MESMLLLVVLFVIMYLMLIRPENKRKKRIENMRNALRKGDTVYTIGGVVGKAVALDDETVTIETGEDRVRIQFAKWAIQNVEAVANKAASDEKLPPVAESGKKSLFGKKKVEETPVEETAVPEEPVAEETAEEK